MLEELGLVQSKANTSCVASLDGVMEVKFLSWLTSKLCIVEIKTRVNKKTQAAADMIKESYGSFVECDFLSDDVVDEYNRTLKNWKPNFNSLHPYAFLWIRLIMSLTLNCHLLFRLFKIEKSFIHLPALNS